MTRDDLKRQILRLAQMPGYPPTTEAMGALVDALGTASDLESAKRIISGIVESATSDSRCPLPGDLRRIIADRKQPSYLKCGACSGSRSLVAWYLVSFEGNSYEVRSRERIDSITNDEQAHEFMGKLKSAGIENQTVLSGAVACHCVGAMGRQAA